MTISAQPHHPVGQVVADPALADVEAARGARRRRAAIRKYLGVTPIVPLLILIAIAIAGIFAPVIAPYNPDQGVLMESLIPPAWQTGGEARHLLGTDHLGRDMLSRLIYGARVSVPVGLGAVFFAAVVGVVIGLISGFVGGRTDAILMRITDSIAAIPAILIMLAMIAVVGPGLGNVVLVIALTYWTRFARMIRGEVLVLGKLAFVESAIAAGSRTPRLLYLHIFPNVVPTLTVLLTLDLGRAIITEASLTFLGLGVQPPTAAWGSMLEGGRAHLATAWWIATLPGLAIMLTVLASNMLGDWLRDIFDPRRRGQ